MLACLIQLVDPFVSETQPLCEDVLKPYGDVDSLPWTLSRMLLIVHASGTVGLQAVLFAEALLARIKGQPPYNICAGAMDETELALEWKGVLGKIDGAGGFSVISTQAKDDADFHFPEQLSEAAEYVRGLLARVRGPRGDKRE